jgi:putative RNA 2'-phosphotransferase
MSRLPRELESLSKTLAYMLGRRPDEFGLVLEAGGWVRIKELLQALHEEPGCGRARREDLERLEALEMTRRLEVNADRIRCLEPPAPELRDEAAGLLPSSLYVAIPARIHAQVWEQGVKPLPGRDLVLARRPEMARRLGKRRAKDPILVTVQTPPAVRKGLVFQAYGEELFLVAGAIPREFLQLPGPPPDTALALAPAKPKTPPGAGAVLLDLPQMLSGKPGRGKKRDEPAWKSGARALRKKRGKG